MVRTVDASDGLVQTLDGLPQPLELGTRAIPEQLGLLQHLENLLVAHTDGLLASIDCTPRQPQFLLIESAPTHCRYRGPWGGGLAGGRQPSRLPGSPLRISGASAGGISYPHPSVSSHQDVWSSTHFMPVELPPWLQYVNSSFLHCRMNAPTPLRGFETVLRAWINGIWWERLQ